MIRRIKGCILYVNKVFAVVNKPLQMTRRNRVKRVIFLVSKILYNSKCLHIRMSVKIGMEETLNFSGAIQDRWLFILVEILFTNQHIE